MFRLSYKRTIKQIVKARCANHPTYNPMVNGTFNKHGREEACATCANIYELHNASLLLDQAARDFELRALPWAAPVRSDKGRKAIPTTPPA
jgi:hypothetical protein